MVNPQTSDREARIAAFREAARPIIEELARLGIEVDFLADLINKPVDYQRAIPLLLEWLPQMEDPDVKEVLVRALTDRRWAKPVAARPLIEEFRKTPVDTQPSLKWAIGNALAEVADASVFEELVELIRDRKHGRGRKMLTLALARTKDPRAVPVLVELLNDEQMVGPAVAGLRLIAPPEARADIAPFVDHPMTWIRNEAKRALVKIDKKLARAAKKR